MGILSQMKNRQKITFPIQILRGLATGAITALAITLFSLIVTKSTDLNKAHRILLLTIPLAAFLTTLLYKEVGERFRQGTNEAINDINKRDHGIQTLAKKEARAVSPVMGLLACLSCAMTHISGASGGKEGAGVQIGLACSSLVAQIENKIHDIAEDVDAMVTYLMCGAAAAFGALFSAPISGVLFGTQFASPRTTRLEAWLPCTISSFTAVLISKAIGIHIIQIPSISALPFTLKNTLYVVVLSALIGFAARLFCFILSKTKTFFTEHIKNQYMKSVSPALVLLALTGIVYLLTGDFRYNGLGADLLLDAINGNFRNYDALLKLVFVTLTFTASFSGGEVVPLLVIGSGLGAVFASVCGLEISGTAAIGALAMLSGGTNLPLVCFALGLELFGITEPILLFLATGISFITSGKHGIYQTQISPY